MYDEDIPNHLTKTCIMPGCEEPLWGADYCQVHYALKPNPYIPERIRTAEPETKKSNPKDRIGSTKLPLDLLSGVAKVEWCLAQLEGALKYGTWNWRDAGVRASIYIAAIERHLEKFKNGEDRDPVTRVHHLGNVMAGAAILLDAQSVDLFIDDRPPMAPAASLIDAAQEDVLHLQQLYGDVKPRNFTIEDSKWAPENDPKRTTISTTAQPKPRSNEPPETKLDPMPKPQAE